MLHLLAKNGKVHLDCSKKSVVKKFDIFGKTTALQNLSELG
jgi:hypothetical protein